MAKELIARYELMVYRTGEIEVRPIVNKNRFVGCSKSMQQILEIIEYVFDDMKAAPGKNIHYMVIEAINRVANAEGVTASTVHAKIVRKLGLYMEDFKEQLKECIDKKAPDDDILVKKLYASCRGKTEAADRAAVKEIIDKIRNS